MKRQWTSYVSITGFVLFAVPVNAHVPTVEFTVAKHVDVADIEYDEAYFNEKIMEAMERVGLYDDQCAGTAMDDHPCAIEFKMNGGMTHRASRAVTRRWKWAPVAVFPVMVACSGGRRW